MSSEEELDHEDYDEDDDEVEEAPADKKRKPKKAAGKKKKDPNKPKRNMSAFFLYSNANRARIKEEHPDVSFGDLAKLVSEEYKALPEKERKKWEKKAEKDKERYEADMKDYIAPDDDSDEEGGGGGGAKKKKKAKKDPNAPKRNMSAYFLYSTALRAEFKAANPDASFGDLAKIISAAYKQLPEKEKQKWTKKAEKDKQRYQEEMALYKGH